MAAPVAPPFPYLFFGRMVDIHGKRLTYLSRDDHVFPIKDGEIVDGAYRVDAIGEREISLTYLPLNE